MAVALDYLLVDDAAPAVVITLNRPDQLNALSTGLMRELAAELERQAARPEVRGDRAKGRRPRLLSGSRSQGDAGPIPR
jgi:enoyl-CoA hydratase/carnithine racemase